MKNLSNIGKTDKTIRYILAALLVLVYFFSADKGFISYISLGLAGILVLTSLISFCPLYFQFGISTRLKK